MNAKLKVKLGLIPTYSDSEHVEENGNEELMYRATDVNPHARLLITS